MKNLIDLNKEWFDRSNELLVEFMKKGGDTYLKDVSFLNLKRDTYFALSNLMIQLSDGRIEVAGSSSKDSSSSANDAKSLDAFRSEINEIFGKFEEGREYKNTGFIESVVDVMGRRTHSVLFENFSNKTLSGVQQLLDTFWIEFFQLKNTGISSDDQKRLDSLLKKLYEDINSQLNS